MRPRVLFFLSPFVGTPGEVRVVSGGENDSTECEGKGGTVCRLKDKRFLRHSVTVTGEKVRTFPWD